MPRRASAARSAGRRVRLLRCPADKRTRSRDGRGTAGFAGAIGEAVGVTTQRDALLASVAAPRFRIEARALAQRLAIDHHCDEKQGEIEQRELVYLPGGLGPLPGRRDTDASREQNSAEHESGDEVDDSE